MKNEKEYIELIDRVRKLMLDFISFTYYEDWSSELDKQEKHLKDLFTMMTRFNYDTEAIEDIGEEE